MSTSDLSPAEFTALLIYPVVAIRRVSSSLEGGYQVAAHVIFDLDGTLVDSLADIAAAVNTMLTEQGLPTLPQETIARFVGNGLPRLVERVIAHLGLPQDRHADLTRITLALYTAAPSAQTIVFPGVRTALDALQKMGCALAVCTNKPQAPAQRLLDDLDLSHNFAAVIGGDTLNTRKPDPAHLQACINALPAGGPSIFVGDSEVDAETAQRAQVPFLLFSNGYRKSPLADIPHSFSYDHSDRIPELVAGILATHDQQS